MNARVKVFEIETGKELADFATVGAERAANIGKQVWSLTFSPNSQLLTTGGEYATQLWDVRQAKEVHRISSRRMRKLIALFSPDGGKIFFSDGTGTGQFWDVAKWTNSAEYHIERAEILSATSRRQFVKATTAVATAMVVNAKNYLREIRGKSVV